MRRLLNSPDLILSILGTSSAKVIELYPVEACSRGGCRADEFKARSSFIR